MGVVSRRWVWVESMGVVSRRWVGVESMGVASGCGCKEVYRFPHITYRYIQWNLRIKDKLVHGPLSTIRRLTFTGGGLSKRLLILYCIGNIVLISFMYSYSIY